MSGDQSPDLIGSCDTMTFDFFSDTMNQLGIIGIFTVALDKGFHELRGKYLDHVIPLSE
jgi:hypothetical protein